MASNDSESDFSDDNISSDDETPESDSSLSSVDDLPATSDGDAEAAVEVRGAEPYRFEPLADAVDPGEGGADERPAEDQDRLLTTNWCTCGKCVIQPMVANCKCCREIDKIKDKMAAMEEGHEPLQCITVHEWFDACCLNPATLETAYRQYRTQYGRGVVEGTLDQKYRHVAYRQVVRWCWGFLGRHNRVALPSCVMDKIRRTYPSADGNYRGYQYPPLD